MPESLGTEECLAGSLALEEAKAVLGPTGCDLLHRTWVFLTGPAGVLGERGVEVGEEHII